MSQAVKELIFWFVCICECVYMLETYKLCIAPGHTHYGGAKITWGQSAAYAMVTSISNPSVTFNGGGH